TKDTENLLKPVAKELANKLEGAEKEMKDAKEALAKNQPKEATQPQEKATKTLQDVRKDVDKMIAEAQKDKADPLAALKKAADEVEKLLQEQKDTRDTTKDTVGDKQNLKLPELANKQKDLA